MSGKKRKNNRSRVQRANDSQVPSEPLDNERTPVPERPEPKKFNAPLWAGGIVVIGVVAVLAFNFFGSKDHLTVDSLSKPAVAAVEGGSDVYPENSALAFTENTKFGYLPAPSLAALGDGTIVAADPETAPKAMGLDKDLNSLDRDAFLDQSITPPRKNTAPGDPITWDQLVDKLGGDTVLVPEIESTEVAGPALKTITEADAADATIVRTEDADVARAAADAGVAAMFIGDPTISGQESMTALGYTMIAVPADVAGKWIDSGLEVWATGVKDESELKSLADKGIFGALSTNPYSIQPSQVKTD